MVAVPNHNILKTNYCLAFTPSQTDCRSVERRDVKIFELLLFDKIASMRTKNRSVDLFFFRKKRGRELFFVPDCSENS